jgi:hypothetical protein
LVFWAALGNEQLLFLNEAVAKNPLLGHETIGRVLVELASAAELADVLDVFEGVGDGRGMRMRQLDRFGDIDQWGGLRNKAKLGRLVRRHPDRGLNAQGSRFLRVIGNFRKNINS